MNRAIQLPRTASTTHCVPRIGWTDGSARYWTLHHPKCSMRSPLSAACAECTSIVVTWEGPPSFAIRLQPHRGEGVAMDVTAQHMNVAILASISIANEMALVPSLRATSGAGS